MEKPKENTIATYKYEGKTHVLLLGGVLFAACAALFYFKAAYNEQGLILNGILTLSKSSATIFYWVLFALSMGFIVAMFLGFYFKMSKPEAYLLIEQEKIVIPPIGLRKENTEIRFADIQSVEELKLSGSDMLLIYFNGKKSSINRSLMPNKKAYQEVKDIIFDKMKEELKKT